jgi:uncharacterized protein YxeA
MKKLLIAVVVVLVVAACAYYVHYLHVAHSTFDNYYAFRGCQQLVSRTDTQGVCTVASGQTITIVKYNNAWYLEGDLPTCWKGFMCF